MRPKNGQVNQGVKNKGKIRTGRGLSAELSTDSVDTFCLALGAPMVQAGRESWGGHGR